MIVDYVLVVKAARVSSHLSFQEKFSWFSRSDASCSDSTAKDILDFPSFENWDEARMDFWSELYLRSMLAVWSDDDMIAASLTGRVALMNLGQSRVLRKAKKAAL